MAKIRVIYAFLFAVTVPVARAENLRVGPGEKIIRIADAAKLAKDGDTVEILSGEYRGDVAVWRQKQLTLRGVGQRPVLIADGQSAEDKAIWVIRDGDIRIENIEFRGSRVPHGNGAGIRFEHGRLHVRDCNFIDNQTGILTSNDSKAELMIESSRFAHAPRQMESLPHLLYVGQINSLTITGSRFENGFRGHLIKSRARISHIHDSHIVDGPGGEASYEIDLPNGGIVHIAGNTIGQSAKTQNPILVSYGAEGEVWPENSLTLNNNVLINEYLPAGWFLRIHVDHFSLPPKVELRDNRTQGLGIFTPDVMHNIQH